MNGLIGVVYTGRGPVSPALQMITYRATLNVTTGKLVWFAVKLLLTERHPRGVRA